MKTVIFYYSATGNSLWTARTLAKQLGGAQLSPMSRPGDLEKLTADSIGFVFPVHMWGVPGLVLRFLAQLPKNPHRYYFACAVNAGQVSRTLVQLRHVLSGYGLSLSVGFNVVLPSNYIPWGGPGPVERQRELFTAAAMAIGLAAGRIKKRETGYIEQGPLWQRILFTGIYRLTFGMIKKMDRDFWTDQNCNGCGICERLCPVANISIREKRPVWLHHCEQCLACIQWCPKQSIQFGKKTPAYQRYHHPEITVKDLLPAKGTKKNHPMAE